LVAKKYCSVLKMLGVAFGPQWWLPEPLLSSGDSPHASLPWNITFESFDHRVRKALLSAANQDEDDAATSIATSARMTHE
jgi:hypothetical protein